MLPLTRARGTLRNAARAPEQRTRQQREAVGVELYGFQQTLAKLQMGLERAHATYDDTNRARCVRTVCHAACEGAAAIGRLGFGFGPCRQPPAHRSCS
jgi:hypothetical protein